MTSSFSVSIPGINNNDNGKIVTVRPLNKVYEGIRESEIIKGVSF